MKKYETLAIMLSIITLLILFGGFIIALLDYLR